MSSVLKSMQNYMFNYLTLAFLIPSIKATFSGAIFGKINLIPAVKSRNKRIFQSCLFYSGYSLEHPANNISETRLKGRWLTLSSSWRFHYYAIHKIQHTIRYERRGQSTQKFLQYLAIFCNMLLRRTRPKIGKFGAELDFLIALDALTLDERQQLCLATVKMCAEHTS